jgi:thiamine-monophosphate kinase
MTAVLEHLLIGRLAAGLPRSPSQVNRLHESDAELVRLPGTDLVLALTTDALAEEIATGLYADPWLIGWMLVTVNASDLAAVGADPLGLLICETLPPEADDAWLAALQHGIADAAIAYELPVLGGDTNAGAAPHLAATAVGLVRGRPLTRCGARPGDLLFASGPLGAGSAYALARLRDSHGGATVPFRPTARLREGALLRDVASACMDTSDGAIATMDELMTRNGVGLRIESPVERWTDPAAGAVAHAAGIPPWLLHAGPHGEFELLFTVPADRVSQLGDVAGTIGWRPIRLGTVTAESGLAVAGATGYRPLDATTVRNLFTQCGGDLGRYVRELRGLVLEE